MDDERPFDDKATQFERLWEGYTPKGENRSKALKFRQYILEHVRQMRRPLNKENARRYWMGELQQEIAERENL
jgi:exonuclease III